MAPAAVPCRISVAASSHSPRPRPKRSTGAGPSLRHVCPPPQTVLPGPGSTRAPGLIPRPTRALDPVDSTPTATLCHPLHAPPPAGPPAAQVHPPARTGSPTLPTLCHPHARWAPPPSCSWPTHWLLPRRSRPLTGLSWPTNSARVTSQYMACTMTHPRTCHICALPSGPAQPAHPHMLLVLPRECWHPQEHMPP